MALHHKPIAYFDWRPQCPDPLFWQGERMSSVTRNIGQLESSAHMRQIVTPWLAAILMGCATSSAPRTEAEALQRFDADQAEITRAIPSNYKQIIIAELHRMLKDPYSVRDAEISPPGKGWVGLVNGGDGIVVCVRLNAKNSFGAYTGLKVTGYVFRDHMLIATSEKGNPLACQGRAYFPFQELMPNRM